MSNGLTGAAFLGSIALLIAYDANIDYAKDALGFVFAAILGVLFLNDLSSLPVNIFYLSSLDGETDFSNKWVQTVSFGSPIVSGAIFAIAALVSVILGASQSNPLPVLLFGAVMFLPHLLQLVPSILFAVYAKDMHTSI